MRNNNVFGKRQNLNVPGVKNNILQRTFNVKKQPYAGLENRTKPRSKALKACKIIFNDRSSIFDGTILNLSATGAKLEVANARYVGNEFQLEITSIRTERPCTVIWRMNNFIGVEFDDVKFDDVKF